MRPWHVLERNRFAVLVGHSSTIASVIPEAVFDANNDPDVKLDKEWIKRRARTAHGGAKCDSGT